MDPIKFTERELPTDSKHYKVLQIYQSLEWCKDPTNKAGRDDYFEHQRYANMEARLKMIKCPLQGKIAAKDLPDLSIIRKPALVPDMDQYHDEAPRREIKTG